MISKVFAMCLFLAAHHYDVPPAVLYGIYQVEGGRAGQEVGPNTNGTYDLGPMQINTVWMDTLAKQWGVPRATARKWVRDDECVNVGVSAWILRQKIDETGSLAKGIAHYHSATPHIGSRYKFRVIDAMQRSGFLPKE